MPGKPLLQCPPPGPVRSERGVSAAASGGGKSSGRGGECAELPSLGPSSCTPGSRRPCSPPSCAPTVNLGPARSPEAPPRLPFALWSVRDPAAPGSKDPAGKRADRQKKEPREPAIGQVRPRPHARRRHERTRLGPDRPRAARSPRLTYPRSHCYAATPDPLPSGARTYRLGRPATRRAACERARRKGRQSRPGLSPWVSPRRAKEGGYDRGRGENTERLRHHTTLKFP